jgi:hypothetical protein
LQVCHQAIGVQNFDICGRDSLNDLRAILADTTPMSLFENYRFVTDGRVLPELQEVGAMLLADTRVALVLEPFD